MTESILLDTHIIISIVQGDLPTRFPFMQRHMREASFTVFVSVASLWEIAIKTRLDKLKPRLPLDVIAPFLQGAGFVILPVDVRHVIAAVDPEPPTRDPFDRLLLAQCKVENLKLATVDRALVGHPLSLRF